MDIQAALELADKLVLRKTGEHLSDLQREILKASWSWEHQSYDQLAQACGYSANYLKKHIGPGLWKLLSDVLQEKISKTNCRAAFERRLQVQGGSATAPVAEMTAVALIPKPIASPLISPSPTQIDWGEAIDLETFYGRQSELHLLTQWILSDGSTNRMNLHNCRLIGVFGSGGIGKTSMVAKLTQQLVHTQHFEYVIWRSLRNAPLLSALLTDLIQVLSNREETGSFFSIGEQITRLIHYLQQHRCLLVLDNGETILQSGNCTGRYRLGYENYADLFKQMGETPHQSCFVLTSREKPKEIAWLEGETLPVRSLTLQGLPATEGQQLFQLKNLTIQSTCDSAALVEQYGGNPLVLKIVATTIQEIFDGDISAFLRQGISIFDGVSELLEQQFDRLSQLEQAILFWLAIACEPVSLEGLHHDLFPAVSQRQVLEALKSLGRRSLIEKAKPTSLEKTSALFTLQPVVTEYLLDCLIEQVAIQLSADLHLPTQPVLLNTHALIKAQSKDYIRETQIRLILKPLAERLLATWRTSDAIAHLAKQWLAQWRSQPRFTAGYGAGNLLNLLHYLDVDLRGFDFSYLSVWQAYLEGVNLQQTNFTKADLSKSVLAETLAKTLCVSFSPDGNRFVTAASSGEISLWQTATGEKLLTCQGHQGWVHAVAFSPDGHWLASGSEDETVRIWNAHTGQCLRTLHLGIWVWSVAFNPDGTRLASGSNDQLVRLWDVSTGKCLAQLHGHSGWVRSVAFSPDGRSLVSGSHDQLIRIWDIATGYCLKVLSGHTDCIQSVSFSPDGQLLASASNDQFVKVWDVGTGVCLRTLKGHLNWVQSVSFSPNGSCLASGSNDQSIRIWDVTQGCCLQVLQGEVKDIWSIAFSPDGSTLVSGSSDETVKLWDVQSGLCLRTVRGHSNLVRSVVFNVDGKYLANGSDDRLVRIWDVQSGRCLKILKGHSNGIWSVAFNPVYAQWLASGSNDHTICLWDVQTGECIRTFQGHTSWVRSLAFSPDGRTIVSGSTDQTLKLWDVFTGECLKTLKGHTNWVRTVAFSPDGKMIASGSDDSTIRLWNAETGKCQSIFQGHTEGIWAIAFHPTHPLLASGSDDHRVALWCLENNTLKHCFDGHHDWVRSLAFNSTGVHLATASDDHTIKLWDIETGKRLNTLNEHTGGVWSVAFSPTHSLLVSGSEDETIKLWNCETGERLHTFRVERLYEGMNITDIMGVTNTQKATLRSLGAVEQNLPPSSSSR
ncbi:MAG TPA: NB-ARC domain-containing protein [Crinalium sp.]|jgi:WD40 repeat protein